ncbi:MAG: hypothetical protein LBE25_06060 [Arthrobacter sp.]|nr:hypothetical protein [Arthrobacter sp.]
MTRPGGALQALLEVMQRAASRSRFVASIRVSGDGVADHLVGGVSFDVERAVGTSMRLHDQYFEVESFSAELFG